MEQIDAGLAARYARFFRDAMAGHRVGQRAGQAVHTCQCGILPALCAVNAAAVRHGLVDPASLPWRPLPRDLPRDLRGSTQPPVPRGQHRG